MSSTTLDDPTYSAAVTTGALDRTSSPARVRGLVTRDALGALVLAGSLPLLFSHERYQPALGVGVGGTTVDVRLSDLAVLLVVVAAIVAASRLGVAPLRSLARSGSPARRSSPGSPSRCSARSRSTTPSAPTTS